MPDRMTLSPEELQLLVDLIASFGRRHGLPADEALATDPVDQNAVLRLLIRLYQHLNRLHRSGAVSAEQFGSMSAGLNQLAGVPSQAAAAAILAAKLAERAEAQHLAAATGTPEVVELLLPRDVESDW
jgi:hypothetical protein